MTTGEFKAEDPHEPVRNPTRFGEAIAPAVPDFTARAPRPPALPPSLQAAAQEQMQGQQEAQTRERRSILRGLIILAILGLIISLIHAGADRSFPAGWWWRW